MLYSELEIAGSKINDRGRTSMLPPPFRCYDIRAEHKSNEPQLTVRDHPPDYSPVRDDINETLTSEIHSRPER
ncbi:MAG TPA: hypothetical protein DIW81_17285 [Planctomycetaceae bacterium]|nr:hypothetical protein [Planctomycetaceae bacterium]